MLPIFSNLYKHLILVCFVCLDLLARAQNPAANWFFGNGVGLTYTGTAVSYTPNGVLTNTNCSAVISNSAGALLFYTDGQTVYNQNHLVMANGSGLISGNAFQPAMILKKPSSSNLYYVFTVGGFTGNAGLYYSVVDMSLASGTGSVITKNVLLHSGCRDKLTAGKHCNKQDIWIVSYDYGTNPAFISCLLTATGITSIVTTPMSNTPPLIGTGQLKLSPNGTKLAVNSSSTAILNSFLPNYWDTRVFDFNASNGVVNNGSATVLFYGSSNLNSATVLTRSHGVEFSPSGRYVYSVFYNSITKYDLCALTPSASSVNVYLQETTNTMDTSNKRAMQLAPDGKIYIALNWKSKIGVINNPNNLGGIATYTDIAVTSVTCQSGLPNFPGYYFESKPSLNISFTASPQQCKTVSFSPVSEACAGGGYVLNGYQWDFGDPSSGLANGSNAQFPVHAYSNPGSYTITLIRSMLCQANDTVRQVITVMQPSLSILSPQQNCNSATYTATVTGGSGIYSYSWSATNATTSVASYSVSGLYSVSVVDLGAAACQLTATAQVQVIHLSSSVNVSSVLCHGGSGSATISVSGGSGSYQYQLNANAFQTNGVFTNLSAGNYTTQLVDAVHQCTASTTFSLVQPPSLTATILSLTGTNVACQNQSFTMVANPQGGTFPYSYQWNTGAFGPLLSATSALSGSFVYSCTITDANGCVTQTSYSLQVYAPPALITSSISCCQSSIFTVTAAGANSYTWQPGAIVAQSFTSVAQSSSVYTLIASSNGCNSQTTLPVQVNPLPTIQINGFTNVCAGDLLTLFSNSQTNYSWTGPLGFVSTASVVSIPSISLTQAGTYTLTGTNAFSCSASDTIHVYVHPLPTLQLSGNTNICSGGTVTLSVSGASLYSWIGLPFTTSQIQVSPSLTSTYICIGTLNGCTSQASLTVIVEKCLALREGSKSIVHSMYPNPVADKLMIEMQASDYQIRIIDMTGREVFNHPFHTSTAEIYVSNFPSGTYLIEIKTVDTMVHGKFHKTP